MSHLDSGSQLRMDTFALTSRIVSSALVVVLCFFDFGTRLVKWTDMVDVFFLPWMTRIDSPVSDESFSLMCRVGFGAARNAFFRISSCLALIVVLIQIFQNENGYSLPRATTLCFTGTDFRFIIWIFILRIIRLWWAFRVSFWCSLLLRTTDLHVSRANDFTIHKMKRCSFRDCTVAAFVNDASMMKYTSWKGLYPVVYCYLALKKI